MAKKARRSTELPVPRDALVELGLSDEQIDSALQRRPAHHSPRVDELVDVAEFRVDAVASTLKVFRALRHTKTRRWQGKPLDPEAWQIVWVLAPVFGWHYPDGYDDVELAGTRVVRTLWKEIPRKNGKSTIGAGIALKLGAADGEPGAEIYSAAGDRTQASRILDDAKLMARSSPALRSRVQVLSGLIRFRANGGFFRALSRIGEAAHGLNVHGGIIDEIHVHRSRGLIDALESGTGARDQPLIAFLTTADEGEAGTIYAEKHDYALACANRTVRDPSLWAVVWCAGDDDDPFAPETWAKANPGLGSTVTHAYLAKEAERAKATPSYFPTFCRLHLNLRVRSETRAIDLQVWDRGAQLLVEPDLHGRDAHGGLDLSSTEDFTAWTLLIPPAEGDADGGRWKIITRLWLPEGALTKARRKPMARQIRTWAQAGWVTLTAGDVVDYDQIGAEIDADLSAFRVVEVGYDKWNAPPFIQPFTEGGLAAWPVPQTITALTRPWKELERLAGRDELNHGGNPVLRWMASNVVTRMDHNGNVKPDKAKSAESIDGMTSLVNALATVVREREQQTEVLEGSLMS